MYKVVMYLPNGSKAGPEKIAAQVFKDFICKSIGNAGFNFLKWLT